MGRKRKPTPLIAGFIRLESVSEGSRIKRPGQLRRRRGERHLMHGSAVRRRDWGNRGTQFAVY